MENSEVSKIIDIAILAASGTVGQKLIDMIEAHPRFRVAEVSASPKNVGKRYGDVVDWRENSALPGHVADLLFKNPLELKSKYVLSALPGETSLELEPELARRGHVVISNASGNRMNPQVPLVIPELNREHFELVKSQSWDGALITNPNCATVFLAMGLAPLVNHRDELGEIERVDVVTLQAISGAGYPGVASFDILGNTLPNIIGEEEKIEEESQKILGSLNQAANFSIFAHVNRVPVRHGHTVCAHVRFNQKVSEARIQEIFQATAESQPEAYVYSNDPVFPQARLLSDHDQKAYLGRVRVSADQRTVGFVSMGHNLVRGAAGAALLNLEAFLDFEANHL